MAITSTCAGCGKTLAVADQFAGRQARCPECGHIYTVPSPMPSSGAAMPLDLGVPSSAPNSIAGPTPIAPLFPSAGSSSEAADRDAGSSELYWMRALNGVEYGPADRPTLDRWFAEGRVGQNYEIRQGASGSWQPASRFQPSGASSPTAASANTSTAGNSNPFAAQSSNPYATQESAAPRKYVKSDQSGLVLAMGILSWLACPIFGVIGWIVGAQAIADVRAGQADSNTLGLLQLGYYMSMIHVVLVICCFGMVMLMFALSAIG